MDIGHWLIFFTTVATFVAMLAYLPGVRRGEGRPLLPVARIAVYLTAAGMVATASRLWYLILTHRYEFDYVFRYTSSDMPLRYIWSSMWGGQEGTFLLWALYGSLLALFLRFKAKQYEAPVEFFYLGINLFLMFMLIKASPFAKLPVATPPLDGNGLNPLLQDPWMVIHPPVMFFGFASLGIPAAYAMAAMVKEDWDQWVQRSIPWTIFGVLCLGTGLVMGGYWAYSILGWGGFWGWDPVENSSLVPWLVAVSLLHNQIIQIKRGIFRRSNLFLSMMPFLLLTYSTFLTRSGVLADFSVHSFTDLGINQFLAAFMAVFLVGGLGLFAFKFRRIPVDKAQAPFMSREYFMFLGALSFGLFAVFVLLGTSAPVLTRLWGPPSNVQPEFYNQMGLPFAVLITALMASAPFLVWDRSDPRGFLRRIMVPGVVTLISIPLLFVGGIRYWPYLLMAVGGVFATLTNAQMVATLIRKRASAAGGYIAHVGMGLSVVGILTSTAYSTSEMVVLPKGEEVVALGYGFQYMGDRPVEEGRKDAYDVTVRTANGLHILSPTMFFSDFNAGMMKKPALKSFFQHDVYIAPLATAADPLEERIETRLLITQKTPVAARDMVLNLQRFRSQSVAASGHQHDDGPYQEGVAPAGEDGMEVTAEIQVEIDGATHTVEPVLRWFPDGHTEALPAAVPGSSTAIRLLSADASRERAQIGVQDPPIALAMGESTTINGMHVHFNRFDVDMGRRQGATAKVIAECTVGVGDETYTLRPTLVSRPGAESLELVEEPIGRTGMNLVLYQIDTQSKTAYFHVAPAPQEYFYAEVSVKPFIMLLWIGTIITVIGLAMATVNRQRLASRLLATRGRPELAKNGGREAA